MKSIRILGKNRWVCLGFLIPAFVYGLVLPFCWGNNPADTYGTLSLLCEHRVGWFWMWTVLTGGCFLVNLERLFLTHRCRSWLPDLCACLSVFGMVLTAATLNHSIATWNPKRVTHWIGAILYAAFILAAFLLFFILQVKRSRRFLPFLIFTALMVVVMFVWLVIIGRNGYMECIPVALFEIMLFLLNFTRLIPPENNIIK